MITNLYIDGFKSFRQFSLELRPGLNIIAGPNGSGKTNIIRFLEFLAHLTTGSLVEAVSRTGGAGAIFRQTPAGGIHSTISFLIEGKASHHYRPKKTVSDVRYKYSAEIKFSKENNLVFFSKQSLEMLVQREHRTKKRRVSSLSEDDVFNVQWQLDDRGVTTTTVNSLDDPFRESTIFSARQSKEAIQEFIKSEISNELKDRSFPVIFRHFIDQIEAVSFDLLSGRTYNIDPNVVRQSEDIAGEPGIKADGGGLAATLNAARSAARTADSPGYMYPYAFWHRGPTYDSRLISELANYSKLVNNDILDIDVESDSIENKLRVFLKLSYDGDQLRLPLSLASDGTVKWLALVAAVLTNRSVVAVEEPENFLHPFMQREIINIIRSSCEKSSVPTFAIVTTHSETLINSVSPDELVILSMTEGATKALRPENTLQLKMEIEKTGFGLGYYFLSGAIE